MTATQTVRSRGSYAKTAARRREILEAGMDVFAEQGFRSGSLREIAERVGMSQAGLLHHFATKNDLLAAILDFRDDRDREESGIEIGSGLDGIRGLLRLVEHNMRVPGLVELHCVLSAEATSPDHPAHEHFVRRYSWLIDGMTVSFEVMARTGQLAAGVEPASAARMLIAMMDGLQLQWLLDRSSVDMAEEVRRSLRPLLTVEL